MVIFHSYVSLPEGKSGLSFLRCQWEGQGLTIGDFFASRSVSTAMWCSYTKSTLAIAHPRALWFCSPTFQKSRGLWLTKHASLANKTYKTAALCTTPPGQNDTAWSRLQLCCVFQAASGGAAPQVAFGMAPGTWKTWRFSVDPKHTLCSYGHLPVITGYFYGIIHSINGVLSTYNW